MRARRFLLRLGAATLLMAGTWSGSMPPTAVQALDDGIATTPIMGWSSWSALRSSGTQAQILAEGNAMVADQPGYGSLRSHGYTYLNIDAGWSDHRDAYGRPVWSASRFPNGIPWLATQVHAMGLKLGIYLNPGLPKSIVTTNYPILGTPYHLQDIANPALQGNTLGGADAIDFTKPGSHEYIQSLTDLYASWGVDYIKDDFVGPGGGLVPADNRAEIQAWGEAIPKTTHPFVLELSNWLSLTGATTWQQYSNGWRIQNDIECHHGCGTLTTWNPNVARLFTTLPGWGPYISPGAWPDLDSLELGNGPTDGLTADQKQSVMTLWSIAPAPLILGSDLTHLDPVDLPLMTNDEVIAVNQSGVPAEPLSQATSQQAWVAHEADGSYVVALFNLGTGAAPVSVSWSQLNISGTPTVRDLWTHSDLGPQSGGFSATLNPYASRLLRVFPPGVPAGPMASAAPTNLYSNPTGTGQLTLGWAPPANFGGTTVSYYDVYLYGSDGSTATQLTANPYLAVTTKAGVYYTFVVTAWNQVGWSAWGGWAPWELAT